MTAPKKSRPFSEMEYPSCNTNMKQKEEQQHRQQKNNDELPDTDKVIILPFLQKRYALGRLLKGSRGHPWFITISHGFTSFS